jgi:hypothetical protein
MALVASLWWAILLAIAWALMLGVSFAAVLYRLHAPRLAGVAPDAMRATAFFAGAVGGASEMTLLAERVGARTDLVAAAHSLRLMVVVLVIPFGLQASGLTGVDVTSPGPRIVHPSGLLALGVCTVAGALLMQRLGRANPWFMGSLVVAMGFTMAGITLSAIPVAFVECRTVGDWREPGRALHLGLPAHRAALAGLGGAGHPGDDGAVRRVCLACLWAPACIPSRCCWAPRPAASPRCQSRPRCCNWASRWSPRFGVPAGGGAAAGESAVGTGCRRAALAMRPAERLSAGRCPRASRWPGPRSSGRCAGRGCRPRAGR